MIRRTGPLLLLAALLAWAGGPALAADQAAKPATGTPANATPATASAAGNPAPAGGAAAAGAASGSGDLSGINASGPIQIDAEEGIEWHRDEKTYVAKGNARATRGEVALNADTLTAYYDDSGGNSRVTRVVAAGHVRIVTPTQTVYGDRADYDIGQGVLVITGHDLKAVTPTQTLTAKDRFEYWTKREAVVARGDATAVEPEKKVRADVLTGYFLVGPDGKRTLRQVEAVGNVVISDKAQVARGQKAIYDIAKGIATLSGGVKITRGKNQLNGEFAEVNLNTGLSRMMGGPKGKPGRVHTLIVPEEGGGASILPGDAAQPKPKKKP
ncbi:MAG: LptA/OstA family protein [Dongiaceae bacterium]